MKAALLHASLLLVITLIAGCGGEGDGGEGVDPPAPTACNEAADCNDQNPCTDETCPAGSCVYSNNTLPCDDGDACTLEDVCSGGTCSGEPLDMDGDGYVSDACSGGNDCDDNDAQVHPGATEAPGGDPVCSDSVDNDCDGHTDAQDSGCLSTTALTADHLAVTSFPLVPETAVEQAKSAFRIAYGHTSHGSQVVSGMGVLASLNSLYAYGSAGGPGVLSLHDGTPAGDLGNPDRTTWAQRTRELLDAPGNDRNLIMWSWCGQADTTAENIDLYLSLMDQLETDYPEVTFVYMTGHLNGTGEGGNLHQRNEQIRAFCRANNKVLFDFADIESYDPDGAYFLDLGANDNCDYSGGNWAVEWCSANPASDLCLPCSCAHSQALNCNLKARALWWMLARLSGWDGP